MAKKDLYSDKELDAFEKLKLEPGPDDGGDQFEGDKESGFMSGLKEKFSALGKKLFNIIKLVMGLSFLTFVYSSTMAFLSEFAHVEPKFQRPLWEGIVAFVIVYFFVYEPVKIFQKGQKLLEFVFKFFAPLVKVAPYVLPIYTLILFALYPLAAMFWPYEQTLAYFVFLFGFSMALHLVFSAKALRTKKGDFLKANYIFGFSLVYIIDIVIFSLCLNMVFAHFSFVSFFGSAYQISNQIIGAIIKQVFVL